MTDEATTSLEGLRIGDADASAPPAEAPKPTVILVIGMAGSGKTTFMQRLNSHLHTQQHPGYIVNLDPAVTHVPYSANIDIRDTVNYKNVMKQYSLGPNGAILTSLNLFATRFDQVVGLCEKPREPALRYVAVDTPGQIEIFTWSASGAIITEAFASTMPTMVAYIIDTPRCAAPQTFMTNMLQACSILYKTRLPLLLVFNKTDVVRHDFALEWMEDFDTFHAALEGDSTYAATLSRSMSLVLDGFYAGLASVGVSAVTGEGMGAFFDAVDACARQYEESYRPEVEARAKERSEQEAQRAAAEMDKFRRERGDSPVADQDMQDAAAAQPAASGSTKQQQQQQQQQQQKTRQEGGSLAPIGEDWTCDNK